MLARKVDIWGILNTGQKVHSSAYVEIIEMIEIIENIGMFEIIGMNEIVMSGGFIYILKAL